MALTDPRTRADILAVFKERSESRTPEWNMNISSPDIASALAIAYADMVSGTLKRLGGVPLKNKTAFFNMTGARLLPAEPSRGFVCFSLASGDNANTFVPAGTALAADADDPTKTELRFETTEDITVSSAKIEKIFCTDDETDYIGECENFRENAFFLFGRAAENLQRHTMVITHPFLFDLSRGAEIRLEFFRKGGARVSEEIISALADEDCCGIEYRAGEEYGFVGFDSAECVDGALVLRKGERSPAFAEAENGGFPIKFTVKDMGRFDKFSFSRVTASASGSGLECGVVSDGSFQLPKAEFYPFGERFYLYGEAYFGCREALGKRGAEITFSFDVNYAKIPPENPPPACEIEWKRFMKKSDIRQPEEYDISIVEVVWEYYSQNGWRRLFPGSEYGNIFTPLSDIRTEYKSMTFVCPEDIAPAIIGAEEDFFIRARIIKAENLYKPTGSFISPRMRNLSFSYEYPEAPRAILDIRSENGLSESAFNSLSGVEFAPFRRTGLDKTAVYLGFSKPPEKEPYRIMWNIAKAPADTLPRLCWEYLSESGWTALDLIDETAGFTKSGHTVFADNGGFKKECLFNNKLFWVRVYVREKPGAFFSPEITDFFENSVYAVNANEHIEEMFAMNVYAENAEFELSKKSILDFELYVSEAALADSAELSALEREGRVEKRFDSAGMLSGILVRWNEVETLITENSDSRCYVLDRVLGKITFGDGRHGKIPPVSDGNNIYVSYTVGGGARSNAGIGRINRLERSAGFVTGVMNPKRFVGGFDAETPETAVRRAASKVRTQNRAVTARDFESLSLCATRNIRRVRCCPGFNSDGEREIGALTLVVVINDNVDFGMVRDDILNYLTPRMSGGIVSAAKLYIIEPEYAEVNVRASVSVRKSGDMFRVKREIERALAEFLGKPDNNDPIWEIGQLPNEQQIRNCILGIEGIARISGIYISVKTRTSFQAAKKGAARRFILPKNGVHDITVTYSGF